MNARQIFRDAHRMVRICHSQTSPDYFEGCQKCGDVCRVFRFSSGRLCAVCYGISEVDRVIKHIAHDRVIWAREKQKVMT